MILSTDQPNNNPEEQSPNDPSPEQIALRAAEIRRRWSDYKRKRRRITPDENWIPPTVHLAEVQANLPSNRN